MTLAHFKHKAQELTFPRTRTLTLTVITDGFDIYTVITQPKKRNKHGPLTPTTEIKHTSAVTLRAIFVSRMRGVTRPALALSQFHPHTLRTSLGAISWELYEARDSFTSRMRSTKKLI